MPPADLRRFVNRIGIVVSTVVALSLPGLYGIGSYIDSVEKLDLKASFSASQLSRYITSHEEVWGYQFVRLIALIELPRGYRELDRQRVFGPSDTLLVADGPEIKRPILARAAPIFVKGVSVGRVEVATSLRPMLFELGMLSIFGALLGCVTYFAIRTFPLRVIDRTLHALEKQNKRLDETLSSMSQGLCRFDQNQAVVIANSRYCELFDLTKEQVKPGTTLQQILEYRRRNGTFGSNPAEYLKENLGKLEEVQVLADGRSIRILRHPMSDGGWLATFEDITERHAIERKIVYLAKNDVLTGIANRTVFMEKTETACARLRRHGEGFSLLMLDLDRFKVINDTLGHPAGDALLKEAAQRLKSLLGESGVSARLGGDEFAILLTEEGDQRAAADALAARIIVALTEPFEIDGAKAVISVSIGLAVAPDDGSDPIDLVKKADMALYRAKSDGRNCHRFFHTDLLSHVAARHQLENDLRAAILDEKLELHYQPIIDARSGRPCGVEALARWRHPELGMIPPDKFIPLAEQTGLIGPLGEWVLQRACNDAVGWPDHIKVAVNLSPAQFKNANLADVVMCALVESGLSPQRLELEVTETVFLANETDQWAMLHQLKGLGISIALDDFGTGYSSLSYLTMFPFDKLKIDKSFTQNMTSRASCAAIVSSALAIGHNLEMATTAEGVETKNQFQILRAGGVTSVQGYLFGKPMPASHLDFDNMGVDLPVWNAA